MLLFILVKISYYIGMKTKNKKENVLIFGYGEMGKVFEKIILNSNIYIWDDHDSNKKMSGKTLDQVLSMADIIIFCVPSWVLRTAITPIASKIKKNTQILVISKGVEVKTNFLPFEVVKNILPKNNISYIAGPMISEEILLGHKASALLATKKDFFSKFESLISKNISLSYVPAKDIASISWTAVLKNVYAMYIGLLFEKNKSYNTVGSDVVGILKEMEDLLKKLKSKPEYATSIVGLGDLITTCMSPHSSNRAAALCLLRGENKKNEGIVSLVALKSILKKDIKLFPYLDFLSAACGARLEFVAK